MRPQSFAYPLFVAVLWLLLDELRRPSRRVYLVLPLLVCGRTCTARWSSARRSCRASPSRRSPRRSGDARGLRRRGRSCCSSRRGCACSPRRTRPRLPHYYRLIFSSGFGSYVTEWAPTTLTLAHAPVYLLALGGLWLLGRTGSRATAIREARLRRPDPARLRRGPERRLARALLARRAAAAARHAPGAGRRAEAAEPAARDRDAGWSGVATLGVAFEPDLRGSRSRTIRPRPRRAAATAAGAHGRVFANERYADWLVFEHPQLAGRIAYDSRFELLTSRQLRFGDRSSATWSPAGARTVRGYPVLVLDKAADAKPIRALLRAQASARRDCGEARSSCCSAASRGASVRTARSGRDGEHEAVRQTLPFECASGVTQNASGANQSAESRGRARAMGTKAASR